MVFKDIILRVIKAVGLWLLKYAKKAWEESLKDYLHHQLQELVRQGVAELQAIHDSETYEAKKKEIIDKLFGNIKLPLILRPFRWLIRNILYNLVEEKIQQALNKLNTLA